MALDFQAMQTEVYARGFDSLNDGGSGVTRVKRWLNDAAHDIDDMERWDYRRASTTGTAPLTISDLGEIESVSDSNKNVLSSGALGVLTSQYDDLTVVGTASYYYLVAGAIKVFPVSTLTLTVTYFKVGTDLSANADVPLMPDRFRMAIVERACAKAYRDKDNLQMAGACLQESDRIVDKMRETYLLQPGPSRQTVMGYSGDW